MASKHGVIIDLEYSNTPKNSALSFKISLGTNKFILSMYIYNQTMKTKIWLKNQLNLFKQIIRMLTLYVLVTLTLLLKILNYQIYKLYHIKYTLGVNQ